MTRMWITITLLLTLSLGVATAQPNPGDLVVTVPNLSNRCVLMAVGPGGVMSTFCSVANQWFVYGITMDGNNRDLVVVGMDVGTYGAFIGRVTPAGVASTLATLPGTLVEDVMVDEDGTYLVPLSIQPRLALARITRGGAVTSILPTPASVGGFGRAIAPDIGTGDAIVLDSAVYRVSRAGNVQVVTTIMRYIYPFGLLSDARTGTVLVSQDQSVAHLNLASGRVTALVAGLACGNVASLAYERRLDTFAVAAVGGGGGLYRVARNGALTTIQPTSASLALACYGSRNVAATAAPQVGTIFPLNFSDPSMPNAPYLAAASFATRPGIPLRIGVVDLQPDPLMALSLSAPWIFRGFAGRLDATGSANATIVIPGSAAVRGTRFFVSFVTYNAGGVQTIANTAGFTIR